MNVINVARDFTKFPAGRYKSVGKGSGEEFRERFLVPALHDNTPTVIELDGTTGYPPSFLEEAFGGLVRLGFAAERILAVFEFRASDAFAAYKVAAVTYVKEAVGPSADVRH